MQNFSLNQLLSSDKCTPLPGVFDPLSAKCCIQAGFNAAVLTGYSVAATMLGEPDIGLMTQTEVIDAVRRIKTSCPELFLIADGDNGHGGEINVLRLVKDLILAGANGVLIEDQVWPKKCGHMDKKEVVPLKDHLRKVEVALKYRTDDNFIVIGRTDSRAIEGVEGALVRAKALISAGVDMVFVEAPQSIDELNLFANELEGRLVANMVPGGKTPWISIDELEAMNYSAVLYPLQALYAASNAMLQAFKSLKEPAHELEINFHDFNKLIGLDNYENI